MKNQKFFKKKRKISSKKSPFFFSKKSPIFFKIKSKFFKKQNSKIFLLKNQKKNMKTRSKFSKQSQKFQKKDKNFQFLFLFRKTSQIYLLKNFDFLFWKIFKFFLENFQIFFLKNFEVKNFFFWKKKLFKPLQLYFLCPLVTEQKGHRRVGQCLPVALLLSFFCQLFLNKDFWQILFFPK